MTAPLVSIVIPVYNRPALVREAIDSALAERDVEVIVVDDCSTDDTRDVVASFDDPRVSYVANETRQGLVGNWNRCLALARAPYVTVFHQDDVMHPENLARKAAFLDAHPSVGMVHSNVRQIGPAGEVLSRWWYAEPRPVDEGVHAGRDEFLALLRGVNRVCCPSVVWRRTWYETLGGFDARLPFTADWEMWMRLALFADVGYLNAALVDYRRHDANETEKFLGVAELEHALLAKQLVLEKYAERIGDAAGLRAEITGRYREHALAEAARRYRRDDASGARPFLAFAASLQSTDGPAADTTAILQFVDECFAGNPAVVRQDRPLRETDAYGDALAAAWPRELAEHVTLRRIVKTVLVKIASQPGCHWLWRFEPVARRLLR